jgi:Zn-dependent protease
MEPSTTGSFRLFRAAGIDVYLHWTWFAFALIFIPMDRGYQARGWMVAEYLTLFGIVLLHEFGHALACRQVGGEAHRIVLWPLGGIAYVSPPARPGAVLWSIAAGPLVNLVLVVPTVALGVYAYGAGWKLAYPDLFRFVSILWQMNLGLLILNLLPVYPLDGGQILHALLWYGVGRWASLQAVSVVGGIVGMLFLGLSLLLTVVFRGPEFLMLGLIAAFIGLRSFSAFGLARAMLQLERLPRHQDCACPGCGVNPPRGPYWICEHCERQFDTFETRGQCPDCGAWYLETGCPHCRTDHHIDQWFTGRREEEVLDPIVLPVPPQPSAPQAAEKDVWP